MWVSSGTLGNKGSGGLGGWEEQRWQEVLLKGFPEGWIFLLSSVSQQVNWLSVLKQSGSRARSSRKETKELDDRKPDEESLDVVEILTFEWGTSWKLARTPTKENSKNYQHIRLEASQARGWSWKKASRLAARQLRSWSWQGLIPAKKSGEN